MRLLSMSLPSFKAFKSLFSFYKKPRFYIRPLVWNETKIDFYQAKVLGYNFCIWLDSIHGCYRYSYECGYGNASGGGFTLDEAKKNCEQMYRNSIEWCLE